MFFRLIFLSLLFIACAKQAEGPDPHQVDGPLLPIELQEGREVLAVENDSRILLARGQEMALFLAPRLVAMMGQAELAEGRFSRPTQKEWLQQTRVEYRQAYNALYQLSGKYDYQLSPNLPHNMQAQVDALERLNSTDFQTAYLDLLRDQLRQLRGYLQEFVVGSLNQDYHRIAQGLEDDIKRQQIQVSRIFR